MAANIVGSTLGSIATGWVLLGWLGVAGVLRLLVAAAAVYPFAALALVSPASVTRRQRVAVAALALAVAASAALVPDSTTLWALLHGSPRPYLIAAEDGSGASMVRITRAPDRRALVFVNGVSQSWLPFGGIHTALGALPAFVHPNPRRAAVIGLGSGDTVFAVAGRPELEQITCIEIVRPQLETLRRLQQIWQYAGLRSVLDDPRITHVAGDGRLHLARAAAEYDVIEADALRPTSAFSGHLYSDAYFTLLRDRLKRDGLAVSWSPTARVHDTFVKVFPHVLSYGDVLVGSKQPIPFDPALVRRRLSDPAVQDHYRQAGVDIEAVLAPYLDRTPRVFGPDDDRRTIVDINTDLYPKDEFGVPRETSDDASPGGGVRLLQPSEPKLTPAARRRSLPGRPRRVRRHDARRADEG
jgi:spermidine synthase